MPTVEDVARHVAGITATENDVLLIGTWVNERWKEIANTNTLRTLRRTGELVTSAAYTTGTVALTQGSREVTGTSTAWTTALNGQYFRQRTNWYEIENVTSGTSLRLVSPFTEASATGASYTIAQRRYRLLPDVRKLAPVAVHMRLRRPLHVSTIDGLNLALPSRYSVNSAPQYIAEMEPDVDGTKRVEIYPFTSTAELIHYIYWTKPPDLDFKAQLPSFIDIEAFREGVMVDVMRHKMFRLMDEGKERASELMRNEYQAAQTRWQTTFKHRVLSQDDALDDLEFMLTKTRAHPSAWGVNDRAITDAYSQVWYSGRH